MRFLLTMLFCSSAGLAVLAQKQGSTPLASAVALRQSFVQETEVVLFSPSRSGHLPDLSASVSRTEFFQLNQADLISVRTTKPELISIPVTFHDETYTLLLYPEDIFSKTYRLRTDKGPYAGEHIPMAFYRGIIEGKSHSLTTLSVIGDAAYLMFSVDGANYRVHPVDQGAFKDVYVAYQDRDVALTKSFSCDVNASHILPQEKGGVSQRTVQSGNCVEIYFECDYRSYQDNGSSVPNTEAWVATLFNEVSTLYANEEIPVGISDIKVWTTTDPYAGLNSTSAMLNELVNQISSNNYNGRLAHLLSTRGLNGGIAYINVLCSQSVPCGVSTSISTNITEFPQYSWSVECVTHELGHNFGSRHTHACVWNGNNTQIDDCGSVAGDVQTCFNSNNPILPADGTIMSYCHLVGVGIDFNLGFGPQPGNLIRNNYENASCNTGVCSPPECTMITLPEPGETGVEVTTNISWAAVNNAEGYRITIGTTPNSGNIVNNVDVGNALLYNPSGNLPFNSNIYVKILAYNGIGTATGCQNDVFTTEANVAPSCTQLSFPDNGATNVSLDAIFTWEHSAGNQQGYKISAGTTPGGTDILNNFNVGNVTVYDPGNLPSNTTLYVRITPYWQNGDITGCPEVHFTTELQQYCQSRGNDPTEEWISRVTIGEFTKTSGSQQYSDFTGQTIHLAAGGSYPVQINPTFSGQTFPEYFRVWIDLNGDGVFSNPSERFFQASNNGTVSGTITIPATAQIGTTRLRVAMKWNAYSTPCEIFDYGEVEDYTVRIHCNLVSQTGDTGAGSLPWAIGCASPGETVIFSSGLQGDTIVLDEVVPVISTSIQVFSEREDDIWIKAAFVSRAFRIASGVETTISGLHIIGGTNGEGSAILNNGILHLEDIELYKHPGASNQFVLKNNGTLYMSGDCMLD